jgi:hypothetical protein
MSDSNNQWIRKVGLFVVRTKGEQAENEAIDLSEFHIKFSVANADVESPNNASIRVYNISKQTQEKIVGKGEFTKVVLNAGYEKGNYGIIFQGEIKQFRIGRENATNNYLDIFAADGDIAYNQGIVNTSLAKGSTQFDQVAAAVNGMPGVQLDASSLAITKQNVPNIRGVVLMGMARAQLRNVVTYLDSGWSIQDGKVIVTENMGYRDGEAVEINAATGMVGVPEQTDGGLRIKCLLNSKIRIGGRVKLNNADLIRIQQATAESAAVVYNSYSGFQFLAGLSDDGMYRAFAVEHEGDSRGQMWYTNLICLAVNETVPKNESVSPQ